MDFTAAGKARVIVGTMVGTSVCVIVSLVVDSFSFPDMTSQQIRTSLRNDILIPLFLGIFFFYFLLSKMRALAIAQSELQRIASTDSLTAVLNRGAFTMMVEAYLDAVRGGTVSREGALLIVDADHFKKINDTFGHQAGDDALKKIAMSIRTSIRDKDLIGRVGGEEFGVFLPGAEAFQASAIAERIRLDINQLRTGPQQNQASLSVSVGGACFSKEVAYDTLFAFADRNLYEAKEMGRNRSIVRRPASDPLVKMEN